MFHAAYNALMGLAAAGASSRLARNDARRRLESRWTRLQTSPRPWVIGNAAGEGAQRARLYDGMNQTGDYQDTTGYAPVNTAFELRDPSRWQPGLTAAWHRRLQPCNNS